MPPYDAVNEIFSINLAKLDAVSAQVSKLDEVSTKVSEVALQLRDIAKAQNQLHDRLGEILEGHRIRSQSLNRKIDDHILEYSSAILEDLFRREQ